MTDNTYYDDYEDPDFGDVAGIDELLSSHDMNIEKAADGCNAFIAAFKAFCDRLDCGIKNKYDICMAVADLVDPGVIADDDIPMCFALLSSHSDFLFIDEEDEDVRIASYLLMLDEINSRREHLIRQEDARKRYRALVSDIHHSDTPVGEINFPLLQRTVHSLSFKGEALEDDLRALTDTITHSPELYSIAPLVYYAALMRYTHKMQSDPDYTPNIPALLRRIEYGIDTDNGKNTQTFAAHVNVFTALADKIGGDDVFLYCMGFDELCNIMETELLDWDDLASLRPVKAQMKADVFSVFINGAAANPFYTNAEEYIAETGCFDIVYPEEAQKLVPYIHDNDDVISRYEDLLHSGNEERCLPLINSIVAGSGISLDDMPASQIPTVYSFIMDNVMAQTDERIHEKLIDSVIKLALDHS